MEKSSKKFNETAELEALLFAAGDPLSKERLAELLDTGVVEVSDLLRQLDKDLKDRGIILRETAAGWQLSTRQIILNRNSETFVSNDGNSINNCIHAAGNKGGDRRNSRRQC